MEKQINQNRTMLFQLRKDKNTGEIDNKQYEYEKKLIESELTNLENRIEEYRKDVEKKNDLQELYEEIKDSLDDLLTLNFDDEEEFEELRVIIQKLIQRIIVDRDGNISVKTTFGLQLGENSLAENEVAASKSEGSN